MRVVKKEGVQERKILIGMITDKTILGRIALRWTKEGLFKGQTTNLVAGWCVEYWNKYSKAPKKAILSIFQAWAETAPDENAVGLVDTLLQSLGTEYSRLDKNANSEYTLDMAAIHFDQVRMERTLETVQGFLDMGNPKKAKETLSSFAPVDIGVGAGIDVLADKEAIKRAFTIKRDPLIRFSGALGEFMQDALERDGFIAITAPEKRGKSYYLLDFAWRAMLQQRRVAYFQVGDLSEQQILRRLGVRAAKRPVKAGVVRYPVSIIHPPDEGASCEYIKKTFADPIHWNQAFKAFEKIALKKGDASLLKLSCHPALSVSMRDIRNILRTWEQRDWIPDVVIIDYADVLAPMKSNMEKREQINETWVAMSALRQELHCLVLTGTQAKAAAYNAETMDKSHFSDDKRKNAHVSGMLGINCTTDEKKAGIMRMNWLALRENEFNEETCVYVAECRALAQVTVQSTW